MAKTRARPRQPPTRKRSRRPPTFYEGNRTRLLIGALAAVAVAVFFLVTRGGEKRSGSELPFTGGDFHSMVIDPEAPSRVFVGGHQAVAVSTDDGKTWRQVNSLNDADAMGWAFPPDEVLVGGHPGISVSTDEGRTFRPDDSGLPATDIHALGAGSGLIYAASPQIGFLASTDGRKSWEIRSRSDGRSFMGRLLVDEQDPQHVVAPDMAGGATESRDGGRTWNRLGGVEGAMWVSWDPDDSSRLVVTGRGEASVSSDGGESW